jgi:transposase
MNKVQKRMVMDRKVVVQLIQLKSHNCISKLCKISKKRIKLIRKKAEEYGYLRIDLPTPMPPFPETLFPNEVLEKIFSPSESENILLKQKDFINDRIGAGWSPITVYEELEAKTSTASFYRFLKKHDLKKYRSHLRVITEIIHKPGEALLLDWGLLKTVIDPETKQKRKVYFLSGILGHSRYMTVRLVWSNSVEETIQAIESILNELGGAPLRLTSDNPKCFATVASDYEAILNPALERFAAHYGTILECLPPYDPEKKGKVERSIGYIRRLFEAHGDWKGLEHGQNYMNKKVAIANLRKHGTTKLQPEFIFITEEADKLKILPKTIYQREEYSEGKVRRDGHIRFSNKYYSLEEKYIGKEVIIIATKELVNIFFAGKLVETHNRVIAPHISKSTKQMHLRPEYRDLENNAPLIARAEKIGKNTKELVEAIVIQGRGFIDTRKIWGILSLDKKYSKERIDVACKNALDCGELSYQFVVKFLNLTILPENNVNNYAKKNPPKYGRSIEEYKRNYQ